MEVSEAIEPAVSDCRGVPSIRTAPQQFVHLQCGCRDKGFCFYKSINGIRRHLVVDTFGFPFFSHCTKANISDDTELVEMLSHNIDYFQSKPVALPKMTILLDHGYLIEHLQ